MRLLELHDGKEVLGVLVKGKTHTNLLDISEHVPVVAFGILPAFEGINGTWLHVVGPHDVLVVVNALLVFVVDGRVRVVVRVVGLHLIRIGLSLGLQVTVNTELIEAIGLTVSVGFLDYIGSQLGQHIIAAGFVDFWDVCRLGVGICVS